MDQMFLNKQKVEPKCSICGETLSFFGNIRLQDGVICKECSKKISPWYTEKMIAANSLYEMKKHLAYRMNNQKELDRFNGTVILDQRYKLIADLGKRHFTLTKRDDVFEENCDLFDFNDIIRVDIVEEPYYDQGAIDLYLSMQLNHRYVPSVKFRLNEFPGITKGSPEHIQALDLGYLYLKAFMMMNIQSSNQISLKRG